MSLSFLAASAVLAATPATGGEPAASAAVPVNAAQASDAPPAAPATTAPASVSATGAGTIVAPPAVPAAGVAPIAMPAPIPAPTSAPSVPATPAAPAPENIGDEIVVAGHTKPPPQDPMEAANLKSFEVVQSVDDKVVAPMAMGYRKILPAPARAGLRNFLSNLTEPVVALNFLLQLKPGKAAETLGRFAINSTVGLAGLVDVAKTKPFNLPYRRNGLAWTLGYYGVGSGPYLFLPLVGPTTVRDLFGLTIDRAIVPFAVGKPFTHPAYVVASNSIKSLDDRIQTDAELRQMRDSNDPYGSYREAYLTQRQAEIDNLHGRKPVADVPEETLEPAPQVVAVEPVAQPVPAPPTFVSIPVVQPLPQLN